jgi:hypothetical protein
MEGGQQPRRCHLHLPVTAGVAAFIRPAVFAATIGIALGTASAVMAAEETWTAWVRADGTGKQEFFFGHGPSAIKAKTAAEKVCRQKSRRTCSFVKAFPQECAPLHIRGGRTIKPSGC